MSKNDVTPLNAYAAWFCVALFFLYQYVLRVAPGVMVDEFRSSFQMTAQDFGFMGACYLYAYSLLQIPMGIMLDRFGVRKIVLCSIALCIFSTLITSMSTTYTGVVFSRIILGIGSSASFMGALKIVADYLPSGRRGLFMGLTMSMGTVGALTAGKPLVFLLEHLTWHNSLLCTLILGFGVYCMAYILLPYHKTKPSQGQSLKCIGAQIREVCGNKNIFLYAIVAIGVYTPLSAIADLWGTAFLKQKFMLSLSDAAQHTMLLYVGLSVGSVVLPWIGERNNRLNLCIQLSGLALLLVFIYLLYGPVVSMAKLAALLFVIGFLCGAEMLCFTGATALSTIHTSGITIGLVNTLNMLGGALLQYLIGYGLDFQWQGAIDHENLRVYSTDHFIGSLTILVGVIALCFIFSLRLRDKPRQSF